MSNTNRNLRPGMAASFSRVVTLLVMVVMTVAAYGQSPEAATQAVTAFERTAQDYAVMHRRLERQIGPIELGTPVEEINRRIRELATAIRAERIDARPGDFFAPALGDLLRARINEALLEDHYTADDIRSAARIEGVDYGRVRLQVNDTFPWRLAVAMLPCVIRALPAIPPEMQYRIVGEDLVLVDVHAGLIVDILRNVLVDLTPR